MTIAPKPTNFDDLSRVWNDPEAFARERAEYYAQLARERADAVDYTQPRRPHERHPDDPR